MDYFRSVRISHPMSDSDQWVEIAQNLLCQTMHPLFENVLSVLKLSRNARERHTGTFWKGGTPYRNFLRRSRRNARLAFRRGVPPIGLDTARLTTSCRLRVYRLKECPCIWCVHVNMVTFLLFMFCSVSLYIHNC